MSWSVLRRRILGCHFFFNDTATTEIYTLSLHDALPICAGAKAYLQVLLIAEVQHSPGIGLPVKKGHLPSPSQFSHPANQRQQRRKSHSTGDKNASGSFGGQGETTPERAEKPDCSAGNPCGHCHGPPPHGSVDDIDLGPIFNHPKPGNPERPPQERIEIGRASCRERV